MISTGDPDGSWKEIGAYKNKTGKLFKHQQESSKKV